MMKALEASKPSDTRENRVAVLPSR
jgi:hypothetical protein